jgi:thiol-disulfide isomerase/thioredoxin
MRKIVYILTFFLIATLGNAQSGLDIAQEFSVKDVYGTTHTLSQYLEEDKIVVLPFFTTTCGSCNIYTPEIVESYHDFGCNNGDVVFLGINWGANNTGVIDFMAVHLVGYPCISGTEGLGNETHIQYDIASNITALVVLPDYSIAGQFYGPNAYPTRDSLNKLLSTLGAQMYNCGVGISEHKSTSGLLYPNPSKNQSCLNLESSLSGVFTFQIINSQGRIIHEQSMNLQNKNSIEINTSTLDIGVYFAILRNEDSMIINQKLIKI